jgi:hypothetical protein
VASSPLDAKGRGVPKSAQGQGNGLPPMAMEEIASNANLKEAFSKVAGNRGAPGPDRQTIKQVREHLDGCLLELRRSLLDGSYRVETSGASGSRRQAEAHVDSEYPTWSIESYNRSCTKCSAHTTSRPFTTGATVFGQAEAGYGLSPARHETLANQSRFAPPSAPISNRSF